MVQSVRTFIFTMVYTVRPFYPFNIITRAISFIHLIIVSGLVVLTTMLFINPQTIIVLVRLTIILESPITMLVRIIIVLTSLIFTMLVAMYLLMSSPQYSKVTDGIFLITPVVPTCKTEQTS